MYRFSLLLVVFLLLRLRCGRAAPVYKDALEWQVEFPPNPRIGKSAHSLVQGDNLDVVDPPFHSAGYIKLNGTHNANMFYFYLENRLGDPNAPLLYWTNGGPGASSSIGLFFENGPYKIEEDLTLSWSEYGWDIGFNLLYVDQPVGVGYSYTTDERDYTVWEDAVADDMLMFFWEFLDLHPELKDRELFISGESHAGHYLPPIGVRIMEANAKQEGPHINLKGVLIGNGWINPVVQYPLFADFAIMHGLINQTIFDEIKSHVPHCLEGIDNCYATHDIFTCLNAREYCRHRLYHPIKTLNYDTNVYDIRKPCLDHPRCYNLSLLEQYMNLPSVQKQLGVDRKWEVVDHEVYKRLQADRLTNLEPFLRSMLEAGMRVLSYVGEYDLRCNWVGNLAMLDAMEWSKAEEWSETEFEDWKVDGELAGECKVVEPLTFCKVKDAGHLVPYDQGKNSLDMVKRFAKEASFIKGVPAAS